MDCLFVHAFELKRNKASIVPLYVKNTVFPYIIIYLKVVWAVIVKDVFESVWLIMKLKIGIHIS